MKICLNFWLLQLIKNRQFWTVSCSDCYLLNCWKFNLIMVYCVSYGLWQSFNDIFAQILTFNTCITNFQRVVRPIALHKVHSTCDFRVELLLKFLSFKTLKLNWKWEFLVLIEFLSQNFWQHLVYPQVC